MKNFSLITAKEVSVGKRLRRERLRLHMSQEDLAEALGVTARTVSRWEHDQAFPFATHQKQLSRIFCVEPINLFGITDPATNQSDTLPSYSNIPYRRNPFFTGREQILQQLHGAFKSRQATAFTYSYALTGLGGLGKTQIALEYSYQYGHEYTTIFWIAAETKETLFASFASIADLLNLSEKRMPNHSQAVITVHNWLNTHRNWLLIFDNVEDLGIVKPFLPISTQGSLLFTTRLQALGELAQGLDVGEMTVDEGVEFLLRRSKLLASHTTFEEVPSDDYRAAAKIVEAFGGLPLALDQAGAYLEEVGCSLHGYYRRYYQHKAKLLQRRGERALEHPQSVMETFLLSIQRAGQCDPEIVHLLYLLTFLYPHTLTEEMLMTVAFPLDCPLAALCADFYRLDTALATLQNYSLVSRHPDRQTLTIHLLVQEVMKAMIDKEQQQQWEELALNIVNQMVKLPPSAQEDDVLQRNTALLKM